MDYKFFFGLLLIFSEQVYQAKNTKYNIASFVTSFCTVVKIAVYNMLFSWPIFF